MLGMVLGLFAIVVLQNGLRLSGQPAELTGILTGALLLTTIILNRFSVFGQVRAQADQEEIEVRNSQVAALSAVIILAALIVAGSNWMLVRSVTPKATGVQQNELTPSGTGHKTQVAMMPKAKGDPYFVSCRQGAEEAAEINRSVMGWLPTPIREAERALWRPDRTGVAIIAVSAETGGISTVLRKAREKGTVITGRGRRRNARLSYQPATAQELIHVADEAARIMNGRGEFAIITASLSAANQNEWIKNIKARLAEKYPDLKLVAIQPSEGDRDRAFAETQTVLKVYPNVKVIMAIAARAVPGAAEAVKQSGRTDVKVTGLSLPNMNKPYVKAGIVESVVLWNTIDSRILDRLCGGCLERRETQTGRSRDKCGTSGKD